MKWSKLKTVQLILYEEKNKMVLRNTKFQVIKKLNGEITVSCGVIP
jgi:hypothetical protein